MELTDKDYWRRVQADFPISRSRTWLNNSGMSPAGRHVLSAMEQYYRSSAEHGPGAAPYALGAVRKRLQALLSEVIGCAEEDIALVHNTAEGMNMISLGLRLEEGDELLLLEDEYPSNVYPWRHWQARGVTLRFVPMAESAAGFLESFASSLSPKVRVAALSAVHWCTGMPLPIAELAALCRARGVILVVDGTQGIGNVPFSMSAWGVSAVCFSAWKWLLGPLGLGVLAISPELLPRLEPIFLGPDAMADPLRQLPYQSELKPSVERFTYSTPNFADWIYLEASLGYLAEVGFQRVSERIFALADRLARGLAAHGFAFAYDRAAAAPSGIVVARRDGVDAAALAQALLAEGIVARERRGGLRLSPHIYVCEEQIDRAVETIARLSRC